MERDIERLRERVREIQAEYAERGDVTGWFEALYKEAAGDNEVIPWADLEPNVYFRQWAETTKLSGNGRKALVVGCGLGDDAKFLHDLGFNVTAFDISPTAIEWAKKLYGDNDIQFEVADLFEPPIEWTAASSPVAIAPGSDKRGFDFVLEIYTIQPLPLDLRPKVIDAVSAFVAENGALVVVTRGREDDVEPDEMPWPLSRKDLSRFGENGLNQTDFQLFPPENEGEPDRWVIRYER